MTPQQPDNHPSAVPWQSQDYAWAAALKAATHDASLCDAAGPRTLLRRANHRPLVAVLSAGFVAVVVGTWGFFSQIYPPELVREALVHEHREATLRGDFQKNKLPMLMAMGLREGASLPGLLQLQRPCEVSGKTAYHLTTFIEKGGGIVTILAFAEPVAVQPGSHGQWSGRYWRFVDGAPGKTILLMADNRMVLAETERLLKAA